MKIIPSQNFRKDIQVLRGFSVLVVLFYHAKFNLFQAGYLGVDIFFVISGFLITRIIMDGIKKGTFCFSEFYFRRAKRLLPAAYLTFFLTTLLAPFFLTSIELEDFRVQIIGAITFTANIVLWQQSGYFNGVADLKPLLHVWSLSLEEQYYFILPLVLVFLPPRFWLRCIIVILLVSLALCLARIDRLSTFFLLPTRVWELMIGSATVMLILNERLMQLLKYIFWPALIIILVLPIIKINSYHPGLEAILICLATSVVILNNHPLFSNGILMHGLSKIGDISYSLYLVHWPLFAFFNNVWIGDINRKQPIIVRVLLITLSLVCAYLMNRYVEEPFRHIEIKRNKRMVVCTIAASLSLVLITIGIPRLFSNTKNFKSIRQANYGFNAACEFNNEFQPIAECRNSDKPEILIWGDSYAMHLVPGILSNSKTVNIAQATKSGCSPILGIAPVYQSGNEKTWAKGCISFNESVISYLERTESIKIIVLSSLFEQVVSKNHQLLKKDNSSGAYHTIDTGLTEAIESMKRTVDIVRALGKRVVIIAPPPSGGFDIGRCTERVVTHLPVLGVTNNCKISVEAYKNTKGTVLELINSLQQQGNVPVIQFDNYLCDTSLCQTYINDTFIYRDDGHLSYEGSVFLANRLSLVDKIKEMAR
jgi:peptidoglycan/LPS O-acetylase OafA/YrhL